MGESPWLEEFRKTNMARLERIKARAASLRKLVEALSPAPDQERLRRSVEQLERAEGVDAEDFLAGLKG